ncbi:hypothetical protein JW935_06210 [candidate division KSB1 bacterium]|nr:hypothetical protein [candidate division KSB1 bacterium]
MIQAFISDGRLFVRKGDSEAVEIESHFVKEKQINIERHRAHSNWKNKSAAEDPYFSSSILWGNQSSSGPSIPYRFKNVAVRDENTIYYTLTNFRITGLFEYNIEKDEEQRLFHMNDFFELGLDYSKSRNDFVISSSNPEGMAHLQLLDSRGSYIQDITSGDSRDSNPVFSRSNPNQVLFQSAGIGRDDVGCAMVYGPEVIKLIDLDKDEMTELQYDHHYDYLLPKDDSKGNIYCIRRPYVQMGYVSPIKILLGIVTFPVRFVIAIVKFLEIFTELFSRNPFRPAGPNIQTNNRSKHINVLGRTIDIAKVRRRAWDTENISLVPGSWKLIKITPQGQVEVLANKVSSFDIDENDNVYFTNGYKVNLIGDYKPKLIFKHSIIENIKVVKSEL